MTSLRNRSTFCSARVNGMMQRRAAAMANRRKQPEVKEITIARYSALPRGTSSGRSSAQGALSRAFETIPDVANGPNVKWMTRVQLNLCAEGGHTSIDTAVVHDNVSAPDGVENLVARQSAA